MDKNQILLLLRTWENLDLLKSKAIDDPELLVNMMEIALYEDCKESWRAAWIVDKMNEMKYGVASGWIEKMIQVLKSLDHPGKKRHFLKIISLYPIPEKHRGFLIDYCINTLSSTNEPIAVKAHAMQILFNISEYEPLLKEELLQIFIFENEINKSPGISAKARILTTKLTKQLNEIRGENLY